MPVANEKTDLIILIPIHNDWASFGALVEGLNRALGGLALSCHVVAVDDGSTEPPPRQLDLAQPSRIASVDVLSLRLNLGHQRAIAVGLCFVESRCSCRAVIVMDGDGEDSPADIPRLLKKCAEEGDRKIIFAERTKRSESLLFRTGYRAYRWIHLILTGIPVRVGNFSVIPFPLLSRLVVVSDLWNHYAAAVMKARLPFDMVPTERARRLAGQSRMDIVALITHGLSAISVFADRVGVRLLIAMTVMMGLALTGLAATVLIRLSTSLAIPGWATYTSGLLVVLLVQLFMLMMIFVFVALGGRENSSFLPARDHVHFIAGVQRLFPPHE